MKIFNVSLRVVISQVAELPDAPQDSESQPPQKFNDDPLDKQEKILDRYMTRLEKIQAPPMRPGYFVPGIDQDGASMSQNVRIVAANFEDLSAILKKFDDTAKSLPAVPDSVLQNAAAVSFG